MIVLAVALLASVAGALGYEDRRGAGTFLVGWTASEIELGADEATLAAPGDQAWTLQVNASNLTSVVVDVQVAFSAPVLQPLQARLEVTPPGGRAPQSVEFEVPIAPAGVAIASVEVELFEAPANASVEARSAEAALAQALPADASAAQGEWTILLSLAGGAPGPLAGSYDASYEATGRAIEGSARPDIPEVNR